jgi:hypothetical protein
MPRKVLVTLQFGFSILLIIGTIVIYQQIQLVKSRDLGYDQENLMAIQYSNEIDKNYHAIKLDLLGSGAVEAVTKSNSSITNINSNNFVGWPGKPEDLRVIFTTIGLSEEQVRRLREWAQGGGTIVTLGNASRWATTERAGLLPTHLLQRDGSPAGADEDDAKAEKIDVQAFDYEAAIKPEGGSPDSTAGTILRVRLDKEHWLSAGLDSEIQVMMEGSRVFMPLTLDEGTNVGVYEATDRLIAAGLMWPETRDLVQQKAFLMHVRLGSGHLVAFAEDPNFRAFTEATMLLFMNAVLLGAGY